MPRVLDHDPWHKAEAMIDAILNDAPKIRRVIGADAEAIVKAKATLYDEAFDAVINRELRIER